MGTLIRSRAHSREKDLPRQSRVFIQWKNYHTVFKALTNANCLEFTKYCQAGISISMLIAAACVLLFALAELRYPGPRGFLSPRREYQATDKEAARGNL